MSERLNSDNPDLTFYMIANASEESEKTLKAIAEALNIQLAMTMAIAKFPLSI